METVFFGYFCRVAAYKLMAVIPHHLLHARVKESVALNRRYFSLPTLTGVRNHGPTLPASSFKNKFDENDANGCAENEDFFGFNESAGSVVPVSADPPDPLTKYGNDVGRKATVHEENVHFTNYGTVRYDVDNVPTVFEETVESLDAHSEFDKPSKTWPSYDDGERHFGRDRAEPASVASVDEYTRRRVMRTSSGVRFLRSKAERSPKTGMEAGIQDQQFGVENTVMSNDDMIDNQAFPLVIQKEDPHFEDPAFSKSSGARKQIDVSAEEQFQKQNKLVQAKSYVQTPKTAYEYVMTLRAASQLPSADNVAKTVPYANISGANTTSVKFNLDSKGFRVYKNQTQDLEKEPDMFVLQLLKNSILYNDHDIVAINKPYGLQCHHGKGRHHKLTSFLPNLAKHVFRGAPIASSNVPPKLYTVHRLDVGTTGVLLLAKTQEMAQTLHGLLAEGKIQKTYWSLTKGVPSPAEGIVDIPITEGMVNSRARMVLRPDRTDETRLVVPKYTGKTQKAITAYRVVANQGKSALVELQPITGVKHQLRVHLAFALGCPIIGDHKYSHLSKLAPQKLPSDVLQRLQLRQSKVRYLPMHLHSRKVIVPGVLDGRDLEISANLPKHFKENMSMLRIPYNK